MAFDSNKEDLGDKDTVEMSPTKVNNSNLDLPENTSVSSAVKMRAQDKKETRFSLQLPLGRMMTSYMKSSEEVKLDDSA
jgi:hypothetical protein